MEAPSGGEPPGPSLGSDQAALDHRGCFNCGKQAGDTPSQKLQQCGGCHGAVVYCSRECQRAGWRCHKPVCTTISNDFPNGVSDVIFVLLRDRAFGSHFSIFHHHHRDCTGVVVADLSHKFEDFALPRDPAAEEHRAISLSFVDKDGLAALGAELDGITKGESGGNQDILEAALVEIEERKKARENTNGYNPLFVLVLRNLEGVSYNLMCSYIETDHPALGALSPSLVTIMDWDDPLPVLSDFVDPNVYRSCMEKQEENRACRSRVIPPLAVAFPVIKMVDALPRAPVALNELAPGFSRSAGSVVGGGVVGGALPNMLPMRLGSVGKWDSVSSLEGSEIPSHLDSSVSVSAPHEDTSPSDYGTPEMGSTPARRSVQSEPHSNATSTPVYGALTMKRGDRRSADLPSSPFILSPAPSSHTPSPPPGDAPAPGFTLARSRGRQSSIDMSSMGLPAAYTGPRRPDRAGPGDAPSSPLPNTPSPVMKESSGGYALARQTVRSGNREITRMQLPGVFSNVDRIADNAISANTSPVQSGPPSPVMLRAHRRLGSRELIRCQLERAEDHGNTSGDDGAGQPQPMTLRNLAPTSAVHHRLGSLDLDRLSLPTRQERQLRAGSGDDESPDSPCRADLSPVGGGGRIAMDVMRLQLDPRGGSENSPLANVVPPSIFCSAAGIHSRNSSYMGSGQDSFIARDESFNDREGAKAEDAHDGSPQGDQTRVLSS